MTSGSAVVIPNLTCYACQYVCAYQLHIILCLWRLSICAFLLHFVPIILRDVTYFHFVWFVMRQPNGIVKSLRAIKSNQNKASQIYRFPSSSTRIIHVPQSWSFRIYKITHVFIDCVNLFFVIFRSKIFSSK